MNARSQKPEVRSQMTLCTCGLTRQVEQVGSWDGCPLEGGGHTSFFVERCLVCNGICGFPQSNFDLALERGSSAVKVKLNEIVADNIQP